MRSIRIRQRRIDLKVSGREVIQQHIEADVEQIAPTAHQMIEQRRLVLEQQVVTVVEGVIGDDCLQT
jgi:hypothetical protein